MPIIGHKTVNNVKSNLLKCISSFFVDYHSYQRSHGRTRYTEIFCRRVHVQTHGQWIHCHWCTWMSKQTVLWMLWIRFLKALLQFYWSCRLHIFRLFYFSRDTFSKDTHTRHQEGAELLLRIPWSFRRVNSSWTESWILSIQILCINWLFGSMRNMFWKISKHPKQWKNVCRLYLNPANVFLFTYIFQYSYVRSRRKLGKFIEFLYFRLQWNWKHLWPMSLRLWHSSLSS